VPISQTGGEDCGGEQGGGVKRKKQVHPRGQKMTLETSQRGKRKKGRGKRRRKGSERKDGHWNGTDYPSENLGDSPRKKDKGVGTLNTGKCKSSLLLRWLLWGRSRDLWQGGPP